MPCDPNDNTLNPVVSPGLPIPGLGIPFSPPQIPLPDFEFPPGFPQDILDLIEQLGALFPSGVFKPNLDDAVHDILTALASLFNQLAPFLSFYNFIMALLNMVQCIIEVFCALPNAYKTLKALKRLFKRCLPDFLSMFPWAALLAMILALLLLILALIQYIIEKIIALIKDLIRNIIALRDAVTLNDEEAQEAIAIKIASLLCLMENLFAIFTALAAILAIINTLAAMGGYNSCEDNNILGDNCCDDEVCPPFIDDHPDGHINDDGGMLVYYSHISPGFGALDNFSRPESWQFVNNNTTSYPFKSVITSYGQGDEFWPEGKTYNGESSLKKVPYTIDMTITDFDPSIFHPSDTGGARDFIIQNAVVAIRPYTSVLDEENKLTSLNTNGTFRLLGGDVYENEVGNIYYVDGEPATLETFIHNDPSFTGLEPSSDDGYYMSGLEFSWKFSHVALADNRLITYGCIPELKIEREALRVRNPDVRSPDEQVPPMTTPGQEGNIIPDFSQLQQCSNAAMAELRSDVSEDSIVKYRNTVLACLAGAQTATEESYKNVLTTAVNPFESEISVNPDLQFVTREIIVTVVLNDINGAAIATGVPANVQSDISGLLQGSVTLGEISEFIYDGYASFTADISSSTAGEGEVSVSFNNNVLQNILNLDNDNATAFETNTVSYTFIGTVDTGGAGEDEEKVRRRDATDVAGSD